LFTQIPLTFSVFTAPVFLSPHLRRPHSAGAPSSVPSLTRARHAGHGGGGGAQARALSDGVSGFPSRLSPVDSRPRLRSSAHRSVTLRACLFLSSRLRCIVNGARCRRRRRALPEGGGSQQPLLHQGGRVALGALMPQSEALPDLLALKRALSAVFWNPISYKIGFPRTGSV
jgi:hypothetical protein